MFSLMLITILGKMGLQSGGSIAERTFWCLFLALVFGGHVGVSGDSCNWRGSGLDLDEPEPRYVRPVYLHCQQGLIRWTYPKGGLRIQFQPRQKIAPDHKQMGSEFRVCIRVDPEFSGARIYLEGHRRLLLLHSGKDDPRPMTSKRCFLSVNGRAALYVEGEKSAMVSGSRRQVATFSYDLQTLSQEEYEDDQIECRPCSKEELIKEFCSSEFVIKGQVTSLQHDVTMETSLLDVKVSDVIRDSNSGFTLSRVEKGRTILQRALKCDTKFGEGEFLFTGRTILGESVVTCAPRWRDWKIVRNEALLDGSNPCLLGE